MKTLVRVYLASLLSALAAPAAELPVTGRVLDAAGEPIAAAAVRLEPRIGSFERGRREIAGELTPEAATTTETDRQGYFRLQAPAGMYAVTVDARGFVPRELALEPLVEPVELPVALLLRDEGCEVRVTGSGGAPLAGARLLARTRESSRRPGLSWRPLWQRRLTDAEGKARLARGETESLYLWAHHPLHLGSERQEARGSSARVALEAGERRPIAVLDHRGRPAAGVVVKVGVRYFPAGLTDEQGRLTVTGPPGDKSLRIFLIADDGSRLEATLRASEDKEEADDVTLFELPPPTALAGQVIDAVSRTPLASAVVWASGDAAAAVRSAADGSFQLSPVKAGEIYLRAAAAGYFAGLTTTSTVAGEQNSAPTMPLQASTSLLGEVADEDGRPQAEVEIEAVYRRTADSNRRLGRASGGTFRSDQQGVFRLRRLVPGATYDLAARKRGFASARQTLAAPRAGEDAPALAVVLRQGRRAFGTVTDEGGRAVADAEVTLRRQEPELQRHVFYGDEKDEADHLVTTDREGRFSIADVAAGSYLLGAEAPGHAPASVPGVEVPDGGGASDLGTVVLRPGADVRGRVVDLEGEPLAGVEIVASVHRASDLRFGTPGGPADAVTAADGTFVVPDRRHGEKIDLAARRTGYADAQASAVEAPNEEPVILTLGPVSRISGRVLDEGGEPVAGARIGRMIERTGAAFSMMGSLGDTESGQDGRFFFDDVEPGVFTLNVTAEGWQPVELTHVEVTSGRDVEGLEVRLRRGAVVTGTVRDQLAEPVLGAQVELTGGDSGFSRWSSRAETDGDGRYRLTGVEPGEHTLKASHPDHQAASKTLRVDLGETVLDFALKAGQKVSGEVLDPAGEPLAGARIHLSSPAARRSPRVASDGNGRFELAGVADGTYTLSAEHPAYATGALAEVVVAGQPVRGLVVRVTHGAVITGSLTGVEFDELAGCRILARAERLGGRTGTVDFEGRYRLPGVAAGSWEVSAETVGGRRARGRVTVAQGETEVSLDLEFGTGHTLAGVVHQVLPVAAAETRRERPLGGATVNLLGGDVEGYGFRTTDHEGRFTFPDLDDGKYRIEILDQDSGLREIREVEIAGDREIEIVLEAVRVSGRIVDAADHRPLAGVRLRIELADGDALPDHYRRLLPAGESDTDGHFELGDVAVGRWRLVVDKEGYSQGEQTLELFAGDRERELEFRLLPSAGLTFTVERHGGPRPAQVTVAIVDGSGRTVLGGGFPVDTAGQVRVPSVPEGTWELLVGAPGAATAALPVTVPDDRPAVRLAGGTTLGITVPELAAETRAAWAVLLDSAGRTFRAVSSSGTLETRFAVYEGKATVRGLPAGSWRVTVEANDGRSWTGQAVTAAGEAATVVLE